MWPGWSWCWHWQQGAWAVLLCFSMMLLCLALFSCAVLFLLKSKHLEIDTNAHLFAFFLKYSDKFSGSICHEVMTHALEIAGIALEMTWGPGFVAVLTIHLEFQEAPLRWHSS